MASPMTNTATISMIRRMEFLDPEVSKAHILARWGRGITYWEQSPQKVTGRPPFGERPVTEIVLCLNLNLPISVEAVFIILLWGDADSVFDHVKRLFRHDVLGDQFALDLVWPVVDDPIRHVLRQSQQEHQFARRGSVDVHHSRR